MSPPTIELAWAERGPALDAARIAVGRALRGAGLLPVWTEWKTDDPLRPRGLTADDAGPRVYVNGHFVWATSHDWCDDAGLQASIARASALPPQSRNRRIGMSRRHLTYLLMPSAGLALVPKCPLCWMAYASVAAAFGLTPLAARRAVFVALTITLVLGAGAVAWRSWRMHVRGPLLPLTAGTSLVVYGSQSGDTASLAYVGLSSVLFAAIWSAWPRRASDPEVAK